MVISPWKFQRCISNGMSWIWFGHTVCTMCLKETTSSSCALASQESCILFAVAWSQLVISCTCTVGSLLLSFSGPNLEKQSASWLVNLLMYFVLKSYGKLLINKYCSLGVACVRILAGTVSKAFCLFENETFYQKGSDEISSWLKQVQVVQAKLQHMLFSIAGDSCRQNNWVERIAQRPFKLASVCKVRGLLGS